MSPKSSEGFPGGTEVNKLPASAGGSRDTGLIHGSGISPGGGKGNLSREIPRTGEPGELQSLGLQRVGHD